MDRLEKFAKEEARWHFSQQAGLFETIFSRPIYGPLWWLWIFVAGLFSMVATRNPGASLRPAFYFTALAVAVLLGVIVAGLLKPEKRRSWLTAQPRVVMPLPLKIGVIAIPWLAAAAVAMSVIL